MGYEILVWQGGGDGRMSSLLNPFVDVLQCIYLPC